MSVPPLNERAHHRAYDAFMREARSRDPKTCDEVCRRHHVNSRNRENTFNRSETVASRLSREKAVAMGFIDCYDEEDE